MRLGCRADQVGHDLPVGLTPLVRSQPVGLRGEVVVQCRAPAHVGAFAPLAPAAAAALIDVPAAARPPVAVAPPPPPNPLPQPISNINPNAGMAQQNESQPQLATAVQDANEMSDPATDVVAMSARTDRTRTADAAFVLGAATLLSAAAGYQLRRRYAFAKQCG
jgi:hypothetical protein